MPFVGEGFSTNGYGSFLAVVERTKFGCPCVYDLHRIGFDCPSELTILGEFVFGIVVSNMNIELRCVSGEIYWIRFFDRIYAEFQPIKCGNYLCGRHASDDVSIRVNASEQG